MTANEQAFTSVAPPSAFSGEWNQMDFAIRSVMSGMATTTLVQVKAVRPKDGGYEVDAQPMVAQVDGAGNAVEHGVIHGMPVWRVQGGNSAVIVEPAVGDIGVAVFCSSDVSGVKRTKAPTTPGSFRKFDWGDGIYMGGVLGGTVGQFVRMDANGIAIASPAAITIQTEGDVLVNSNGSTTINATGGLVVNADTATFSGDLAVSGDLTTGPGSTFNGKSFDSHQHSGVTAGGANSGPPV